MGRKSFRPPILTNKKEWEPGTNFLRKKGQELGKGITQGP